MVKRAGKGGRKPGSGDEVKPAVARAIAKEVSSRGWTWVEFARETRRHSRYEKGPNGTTMKRLAEGKLKRSNFLRPALEALDLLYLIVVEDAPSDTAPHARLELEAIHDRLMELDRTGELAAEFVVEAHTLAADMAERHLSDKVSIVAGLRKENSSRDETKN